MNFSKTVPFFFILLFFIQCKEYNSKQNLLIADENWRSEIISFPLEFAPSLQYSGTEYIRFAPGWGKENTVDYFSYIFLWMIEKDPKLSSKKLESDMEIYFDGLISMVSETEMKSISNISESKAFFEKVNDSVYAGKILTYDPFITKKDILLNVIVNYRFCEVENKHLVLFNLSPQATEHPIWKKMKKVTIDYKCD